MPLWRSTIPVPSPALLAPIFLALAGSGNPAMAWTSPAPDVVLYCEAPLNAAMQAATRSYTLAEGVPVHIFVSPPDGIIGLVKHRARADVVVADAATLQTLAAGGQVKPESVTSLGHDPYVLIGQTGIEAAPAYSLHALLAAHTTALPDPTTAASFDGPAILHDAAPDLATPHTQGFADTPEVIEAVRGDAHLLGLVQQTEARDPGLGQSLHLVAKLPLQPVTIMGGLVTLGQSGNAAGLMKFLAGPKGQAILHHSGLE